MLALAALYVATGRLGLTLATVHESATLIWPPSGLSLAALLMFGRGLWPGVYVGSLVVNASLGTELPVAGVIALGNTLEAVVGSLLLERVAHLHPTLERVRDVLYFVLFGALTCTLVSATIGVISLGTSGALDWSRAGLVGVVWWLGDAGGAIVVAPILLLARHGRPDWSALFSRKETWIVLVGLDLVTASAFGGFTTGPWALLAAFLPFPFLVWAGVRLGPRGAMLASGMTAALAIVGTSEGFGPFVGGEHSTPILLWAYLTTVGVAALTLAAAIAQREFAEERRRDEEESRLHLERQVNQAQRLHSLGLLAGGVAHDFNNLLTVIRGNAELLHDRVEGQSEELVEQIEAASDRASELCRHLLAYAGRRKPTKRPVLLAELIQELEPLLGASLPKSLELRLTPHAAPLATEGDPTLLGQVLMNLVLNAAEATGERGGAVHVVSGAVSLGTDDLVQTTAADGAVPGSFVFLEVRDEGLGMDGETLQRIFDPFFSTKYEGRGLGLAAVLGIVKSHNGVLDVRSARGRGTTFRVYLPATADTAAAAGGAPEARAGLHDRTAGQGRRVLVADDEAEVLRVVTLMLEGAGYVVHTVPDGQAAVDLVRADPERFDLALLDVTMPRMGGREARDALRVLAPRLPVQLMTGYEQIGVADPADRFLRKPFTGRELLTAVASGLALGLPR